MFKWHEKQLQPTKHALSLGSFNYEWFSKEIYDVFNNIDEYLGLEKVREGYKGLEEFKKVYYPQVS